MLEHVYFHFTVKTEQLGVSEPDVRYYLASGEVS